MVNASPQYPNASTDRGDATDDGMNRSMKGGLALRGPFANVPNTQSVTGTLTLTEKDPWVQYLTPTAARTVVMPATTTVGTWLFVNLASTAGRTLTITDAASTTIGVIDVGQSAVVICDGTTWSISRFHKGSAPLTDSSGGTASGTVAAAASDYTLAIPCNLIGAVAAFDVITARVLGHRFQIMDWSFTTDVLGVGSSASRVFNMEIGTTDVGTTPSTCTVTEASTNTRGKQTAGTTVTGAATGTSTDTFSIECANSGTAFTAGSGTFHVRIRNLDLADALASIIARG